MNIWDAIQTRRSIGKVKPDAVPKETIERLLEMAVCAPNHHLTEPWRFFVITGDGRPPLGRMFASIAAEQLADPASEESKSVLLREERKPLRAPVIIAVGVEPSPDERVERIEEIAAVSAAVQNMLLAAHALGLGAIWRTGKPAYHPKLRQFFGLSDRGELIGFVYVGFPDMEPPKGRRSPAETKTKWIEADHPTQ